MRDYPFYLWHFVYAEMFQKIWVILAVLLGIGGLSREAAHGTAGFTLSLPVPPEPLAAEDEGPARVTMETREVEERP